MGWSAKAAGARTRRGEHPLVDKRIWVGAAPVVVAVALIGASL